jgi:cytochrome c biogenesis protein CcmG/thiol:disulfide interchange protein DsbE
MNWQRSLVGVAVAVPIVVLLGYGLTKDPRYIASPLPGRNAPDFALPMLERVDTLRLSELRGKVVLVNFWASWCIPCRQEHPVLLDGAQKYLPKGVSFIGITYNDLPADSKQWLDEMGQAYPSLVDKGALVAIDYGITGVPETFILDKHGVVAFKKFGPISPTELSQKLDSLLAAP